jgi:hypothetical protein
LPLSIAALATAMMKNFIIILLVVPRHRIQRPRTTKVAFRRSLARVPSRRERTKEG